MKISVIIPTYNRSRVLARAMDSVLAQTRKPFEIIVVDDGSTDDTATMLKRYGDRVTYLYRDNSGKPGVARNTGLEHARGDWVAFIDSDDVWQPDKLEIQGRLIEQAGVSLGLVFSDYEMVNQDGSSHRASVLRPDDMDCLKESGCKEGIIFRKDLFHYFLLLKNPLHTSCVLLNTRLLPVVQGFDPSLTIAEDRDLWIRSAGEMQVGYVPKVTCKYTHEGGNVTEDKLFYGQSVSRVMQKHFDQNRRGVPGWLKSAIQSNLRRQYQGLSFLSVQLGKKRDGIHYMLKAFQYPDVSTLRYFFQISIALIAPNLYKKLKKAKGVSRQNF